MSPIPKDIKDDNDNVFMEVDARQGNLHGSLQTSPRLLNSSRETHEEVPVVSSIDHLPQQYR